MVDEVALKRRAEDISKRFKVRIDYGDPEGFFLPPFTIEHLRANRGMAGIKETRANPMDVPPWLEGLAEAMAIYPEGFVAGLIKAVFFCGTFESPADLVSPLGLAGVEFITFPTAGHRPAVTNPRKTATETFHHELSSSLYRNRRYPELANLWRTFLPSNWEHDDKDYVTERDYIAKGYVTRYGTTDDENDFNEYAAELFNHPQRMVSLAQQWPLIAQKAALIIRAYELLDPRMVTVFQSLGLESLRVEPPVRLVLGPIVTPTPIEPPGVFTFKVTKFPQGVPVAPPVRHLQGQ